MTRDGQCATCKANEAAWIEGMQAKVAGEVRAEVIGHKSHVTSQQTCIFNCISHALQWITTRRNSSPPPTPGATSDPHPPPPLITKANHVQLLVTGSLHLVGGVMKVLGFSVDDV